LFNEDAQLDSEATIEMHKALSTTADDIYNLTSNNASNEAKKKPGRRKLTADLPPSDSLS